MKLLLDEHYSPEIATTLRGRNHDAIATAEAGYAGVGDETLLAAAAEQNRALLTNNARHFVPLARRWAAEGRSHAGVLFTADTSMPRNHASIGLYVSVLEELFRAYPTELSLRDQIRWLRPPS